MPFLLTRNGNTSQSLTVPVNVAESGGDMVSETSKGRFDVTFGAGDAWAKIEVPTNADQDWEEHSTITASLVDGTGYDLSTESGSTSSTVRDNDVPNVTASFSVASSRVEEGETATVSITLKTDGAKLPHNSVGSLWFIVEPGTVQDEEVRLPDVGRDPAPWIRAPSYSRNGDRKVSLHVPYVPQIFQPFLANGIIEGYRYEMTVPIIIVDDERAEGDETFEVKLEWDSYSNRRNNLSMDQGISSRTITVPAHDETPGAYSDGNHVSVEIAHSGSAGSTYTVSWEDLNGCTGRYGYEVYLIRKNTDGWTFLHSLGRAGGDRRGRPSSGDTHSGDTQLVKTLDTFPLSGQRNLRVYCGEMSARAVGEVPLPWATENSVERPVPGTYSSQPALTSLTVSPGTLGPVFNKHGFLYSVLDVPNSNSQITVNATARSGYTISWNPSEDADSNTAGHQVNLAEGYNSIFISVEHDQGINSFTYEVIVKRAAPTSQQENSAATGSPTISGTVQVGEPLTASTSGIADTDGLTNASYTYQWIANDGTSDSDIADATTSTYTLTAGDVGKTIKVKVTFTDDGGNAESLTSTATTAVAAAVPGAPGSLSVSVNDTGKMDVSWGAPDSNGGSDVTGYKVQWKEAADSWDTAVDVSETTVTGTSSTVSGLTDGVEYTFRVFAVNTVGDSSASAEESGTPRETTAPTVSSATVDGATLTLTFSEGLTETPLPAASTFTVNVGSNQRGVNSVAISGSAVTLTLASAATSTDAVTVSYTVPSDAAAARLKDLSDNSVASIAAQAVTNNTAAALTPLTASIHSEPASHDGQAAFTFELRFSENFGISYRTLRDHAFTVTGGEVVKARRLESGKNIRWEITVSPDGDGTVTTMLPITTDCTAVPGAVCTGDGRKLSNRLELTVSGPAAQQSSQQQQENSAATGSPTIRGTVQVGETLTASTSGISDTDGLTNVSYTYQWVSNDGTSDSDIANATSSSYTLVSGDVGKTIKVQVSFTDDGDNEETLTSAATTAVAASVPGAPGSLSVSVNDTGKLDLSWDAPGSDGGSAVTGYRVQWKGSDGSWGTPADVSEATVTGAGHTVSGLTDGVEYTFRVYAVNTAGDSPASAEEPGTPRETTAPTASSANVDGATLAITFSEDLSESPVPATTTFTVNVGSNQRGVTSVAISGSTVTLTLASAVTSTDAVTVSYTAPAEATAARLKDLSDNSAASFAAQAVTNNTAAALTPLTASSHSEPASHDGQAAFTFELRFSENLEAFSYRTLRDHAFTVTGGEVVKARRLESGKNIRWEITVNPDGDGTVTIVLPITTDCTAQGAICTGDGRKLSNRLEVTVSGASS